MTMESMMPDKVTIQAFNHFHPSGGSGVAGQYTNLVTDIPARIDGAGSTLVPSVLGAFPEITHNIGISCRCPWVNADITGYWRFENNVLDETKNDNDGTATDLTYSASGKLNSAGSFNGTSSRVACGQDTTLDFASALSLGVWVKRAVTAAEMAVINRFVATGNKRQYCLHFMADDTIKFQLGYNNGKNAIAVQTTDTYTSTTAWYLVLVRWDKDTNDGKPEIWVNNSEPSAYGTQEALITDAATAQATDFAIGAASAPGGGTFFNGLIDEVFAAKTYISDAFKDRVYNSGVGSRLKETRLLRGWRIIDQATQNTYEVKEAKTRRGAFGDIIIVGAKLMGEDING